MIHYQIKDDCPGKGLEFVFHHNVMVALLRFPLPNAQTYSQIFIDKWIVINYHTKRDE